MLTISRERDYERDYQPVTGDYAKSVFAYVISTLQYLLQYSNPKCRNSSKKKESDESQYSFIVNN